VNSEPAATSRREEESNAPDPTAHRQRQQERSGAEAEEVILKVCGHPGCNRLTRTARCPEHKLPTRSRQGGSSKDPTVASHPANRPREIFLRKESRGLNEGL
jgi:hypothetical protein